MGGSSTVATGIAAFSQKASTIKSKSIGSQVKFSAGISAQRRVPVSSIVASIPLIVAVTVVGNGIKSKSKQILTGPVQLSIVKAGVATVGQSPQGTAQSIIISSANGPC